MRLATATACFGSQTSSSTTILIFLPLTPPASLIAWAAASAPRFIWSPIDARGPVIGPATAMGMSWARTGVAKRGERDPRQRQNDNLVHGRYSLDAARVLAAGRGGVGSCAGAWPSGERLRWQPPRRARSTVRHAARRRIRLRRPERLKTPKGRRRFGRYRAGPGRGGAAAPVLAAPVARVTARSGRTCPLSTR